MILSHSDRCVFVWVCASNSNFMFSITLLKGKYVTYFLLPQQRFDIQYMKNEYKWRKTILWLWVRPQFWFHLVIEFTLHWCLPHCDTGILLDTQSVYHPKLLVPMSCGNKLYASQQPESLMSQKATFTHLIEPPHIRDILSPFPFQRAVVTAHLLPLSTQHSNRDSEILVVQSD